MEAAVKDILYEHNVPIYEDAMEYLNRYGKVAVVQPTGSGKTYIAMAIMENYSNFTKIVIGPSQTFLDIISRNSFWDKENTVCLTYQYLAAHRGSILDAIKSKYCLSRPVGLIVVDELHRLGAPMWNAAVREIIQTFPNADLLGLTATPIRYSENRNMVEELFDGYSVGNLSIQGAIKKNIFNKMHYIVGVKEADRELRKLLVKYRNHTYITSQFSSQINQLKNKWCTEQSFQNTLSKYIGCVDEYKANMESRHIVFVPRIQNIGKFMPKVRQWFSRIYPGYTINMYSVHSDKSRYINSKEIKEFSDNLSRNEVKVIIAVQMMNESFHFDSIKSISIFRETNSVGVFIQQIGRGMSALTEAPYIFDFVDNFDNIGDQALLAGEINKAYGRVSSHEIFAELNNETSECLDELRQLENKINNRIKLLTVMMCRTAKKIGALQNISDEAYKDWAVRQYRTLRYQKGSIVEQHYDDLALTGFIDEVCGEDWYRQFERIAHLSSSEKQSFIKRAKLIEICNQFTNFEYIKEKIQSILGVDFSDCYDIEYLGNLLDQSNMMTKSVVKLCKTILNQEQSNINVYIAYTSASNNLSKEDVDRRIPLSNLMTAICCRIWKVVNSDKKYEYIKLLNISKECKLLIYAIAVHKKNKWHDMQISKADALDVDSLIAKFESNGDRDVSDILSYFHIESSYKLEQIFSECFGFDTAVNELNRHIGALSNATNSYAIRYIKSIGSNIESSFIAEFKGEYFRDLVDYYINKEAPYVAYYGDGSIYYSDKNSALEAINGIKNKQTLEDQAKAVKIKYKKQISIIMGYIYRVCESEEKEVNIQNFVNIALSRIEKYRSGDITYNKDIIRRLGQTLINAYNLGSRGVQEFSSIVQMLSTESVRRKVLSISLTHKTLSHINDIIKDIRKSDEKADLSNIMLSIANKNRRKKLIHISNADVLLVISYKDIVFIHDSLMNEEFLKYDDFMYKLFSDILALYFAE